MTNNKAFRPSGRSGLLKIELTLYDEVVRALKWLYSQEQAFHGRRSIKQLCEHALCAYAETAYIGKPFSSFRRDALKRRKPVYQPMTDAQLLVEETADAMEWGQDLRRKYRRNSVVLARAVDLVRRRREGKSIRWTKTINKPAP